MGEAGSFAMFIAVGAAWVALLVGPIGQAVARRLTSKKGSLGVSTGEMTAERVAEIEQRLADLEVAQARISELEERLDFAERLLAQPAAERREPAQGGSR
ncbi:MAG: hypothetical protein ACT4PM_07035 [Gemmatimonadales bacterium]